MWFGCPRDSGKTECDVVQVHTFWCHGGKAADFRCTITTFQSWLVNPGGCCCYEYYFHWIMPCWGPGFVNILKFLSQLSHVLNTGKSWMQKPRSRRLHELRLNELSFLPRHCAADLESQLWSQKQLDRATQCKQGPVGRGKKPNWINSGELRGAKWIETKDREK